MNVQSKPPTILQKICMTIVFRLLRKIDIGQLALLFPDGQVEHFGDQSSPCSAEITILDYRFFTDFILRGDVGLGESFMAGIWDTKDIPLLFRLFIKNRRALKEGNPAASWLLRQKNRLWQFAHNNTIIGSRKNIRYHYDLSNEFFEKFLDPSLLYSCGIYHSEGDSCADAQTNKIKIIINKARLKATDHVLEIGCGWCGFALEAVKQTGCRITGITVSEAQRQLAAKRVKQEGLENRIDILLKDYRGISGVYDKIVSIEMLEAVGHRYFGTFFQVCDRLLKPGGLLVIQVITVIDQHYDEYRREADWIRKHIFPGGLLPSVTVLCKAATEYSSFVMESMEDIGVHYATTLKDWREKFLQNMDDVAAMGFDHSFLRKWEYYLAICEAGFAERALGDIQVVFRKPEWSGSTQN